MTNDRKWELFSHLIAEAIGVGEILKNESNYDYKIDVTKSNEKLADDGVEEFDLNIHLYVKPKIGLDFIQSTYTISKTGTLFTK